jgi:hypothetical protein
MTVFMYSFEINSKEEASARAKSEICYELRYLKH